MSFEKEDQPAEKLTSSVDAVDDKFYDDLVGIELFVPCSTWDESEALRCWGEGFASMSARGVVKKVTLQRKSKMPRFEITFPDKKYQKTFIGFDMDYVMTHSQEVPLKYHQLKAENIMRAAKETERAMLAESNAKKAEQAVPAESNAKNSPTAHGLMKTPSSKKKSNNDMSTGLNSGKKKAEDEQLPNSKKQKNTPTSQQVDDGVVSDEATDNEEDATEEGTDLLEEGCTLTDVDIEDIGSFEFDTEYWKVGEGPAKVDKTFRGASGPQHTLPAGHLMALCAT
jgi:hypothetical protein